LTKNTPPCLIIDLKDMDSITKNNSAYKILLGKIAFEIITPLIYIS
jgi:hypothetical protein